jgi:anti-sigma factor RsiW
MALTCREFIDSLIDYSSGEFDPNQSARLEAHLLWCRNCAVYLSTYEATIRLSRGAFQYPDEAESLPVPDDLVQTILAACLLTRNRPPPGGAIQVMLLADSCYSGPGTETEK